LGWQGISQGFGGRDWIGRVRLNFRKDFQRRISIPRKKDFINFFPPRVPLGFNFPKNWKGRWKVKGLKGNWSTFGLGKVFLQGISFKKALIIFGAINWVP